MLAEWRSHIVMQTRSPCAADNDRAASTTPAIRSQPAMVPGARACMHHQAAIRRRPVRCAVIGLLVRRNATQQVHEAAVIGLLVRRKATQQVHQAAGRLAGQWGWPKPTTVGPLVGCGCGR